MAAQRRADAEREQQLGRGLFAERERQRAEAERGARGAAAQVGGERARRGVELDGERGRDDVSGDGTGANRLEQLPEARRGQGRACGARQLGDGLIELGQELLDVTRAEHPREEPVRVAAEQPSLPGGAHRPPEKRPPVSDDPAHVRRRHLPLLPHRAILAHS